MVNKLQQNCSRSQLKQQASAVQTLQSMVTTTAGNVPYQSTIFMDLAAIITILLNNLPKNWMK
jgi:hypothetical protein